MSMHSKFENVKVFLVYTNLILGGIFGEGNRAEISALSKKKENHVCSECSEFGKQCDKHYSPSSCHLACHVYAAA